MILTENDHDRKRPEYYIVSLVKHFRIVAHNRFCSKKNYFSVFKKWGYSEKNPQF